MTKQEIFILNRALDGSQIYGMPEFEKMHLSELLIDTYKDGMINRGLLADKANLTEHGADVVSRIRDYKASKCFVSVNNLTIGKSDKGKNVSLIYNPLFDEYKFTRIDLPEDCSVIFDAYPFINEVEETEKSEVGHFSEKEIKQKCVELNAKNSLIIKKNGDVEKSYTVYIRDKKAFMYVSKTGCLYSIGRNELKNIMKEELS